jgi:hypothetical protein
MLTIYQIPAKQHVVSKHSRVVVHVHGRERSDSATPPAFSYVSVQRTSIQLKLELAPARMG